jgi:hypothetical protein
MPKAVVETIWLIGLAEGEAAQALKAKEQTIAVRRTALRANTFGRARL